ncbi:uncharacterized protein LOC117894541 [Drosophila subobscura]|uniref:uncharacterized protein LOC117894541 n=1 Tax=Drosophila subobscura TaxID=7241 RepID=UPI00155B1808|nr:uncharacterized protein LOC117894541 [Drosophila subobscura]
MDTEYSFTVKLSVNGGPARTLEPYIMYRIGYSKENEFFVDHQCMAELHAYAFKMQNGVTQIAAVHGLIKVNGMNVIQINVGLEDADENGNVPLQFGEVGALLQITEDPLNIKNPFPKYSENIPASSGVIPPRLRYRSKSLTTKSRKRVRNSSAPPQWAKRRYSSKESTYMDDLEDEELENMDDLLNIWGDFDL